MWERQTTSSFVWRFAIMQLTCIQSYLESLHYILTLLFLLQPHFDSLSEQILVNFSQQVDSKWVKAWDTTLRNIKTIYCMYGVTNAQWNGVFFNNSHIFSLGAVHYLYMRELHIIISQLQCHSYRYAKMWLLKDGLIDQ